VYVRPRVPERGHPDRHDVRRRDGLIAQRRRRDRDGVRLGRDIGRRDLPLIEATVFVISIMIITLNLLVDMLYTRIDPRIRFGSAAA
jgi:hypothetical protein